MTQPAQTVERQIVLPLSKAIEIAYKSIRLRLSRSLLVTSGIVLALAFLMSIMTSEALTASMREWANSPHNAEELANRRHVTEGTLDSLKTEIHAAAGTAATRPAAASDVKFSAKAAFGQDFADMQKDLGNLPASPDDLTAALTLNSSLVSRMESWIASSRKLKSIQQEQTSPQRLQALMKANGVPSTTDEIASSRLQTRWLIGLALLVAFVGILNSMLMSVTERFREIGTMKCLGALNGFIVKLFLLESLFQGAVGTLVGLILGFLLSIGSAATTYGTFAWKNFPTTQIVIASIVTLIVGMTLTVAGAVYPAWQASRMQPIDAMRVET